MALGNRIILSGHPKGVFEEIIVDGTPKPGTVMYRKSTAEVSGVGEWEPAGTTASLGMGADGDNIPIAVLLCFADHAACPPGRTAEDAYADGERGAVYFPAPGEKLNMLFGNASGTADDVTIGMKMIVNDGDGKLIPTTGTPSSQPFVALEAISDPTADQLFQCQYSGH